MSSSESQVELFGILNVTDDSFSDGGLYINPEKALHHADELFEQGASYVDVGAESTRPGAEPLTPEVEWQRLAPVLPVLLKKYPGQISLDTYHPEIVRKASKEGGTFIINDVTAFNNPLMIQVAVETKLPVIVSHLPQAHNQDIQAAHQHKINTVKQVYDELMTKRQTMIDAGVKESQIILDPGIGFGKTMRLSRQLLKFAELVPGIEVMVGYSRKRFLGDHRMDLDVNLKAGRTAIAAGTKYLRVHDVAGHRQLLNS